jgi:hypothetical protein
MIAYRIRQSIDGIGRPRGLGVGVNPHGAEILA